MIIVINSFLRLFNLLDTMLPINKFFVLFGLLFISTFALAQNATIRGFVYEKETGEPLIFTNVYLTGTTYGVNTDVNGFYTISKIKPGTYTLTVSAIGFETLTVPITLKADEIISKKLYVGKRSIELQSVEVSAERQEMKTEVRMSVQKV